MARAAHPLLLIAIMPPGSSSSGGSIAAQHPSVSRGALAVAPTDGSARFNTLRIPLVPVACFRLNAPAFVFDSSFVGPNFRFELTKLAGVLDSNQGCPAALFGHCDPAGSDALNKTLGDRRAIAVYALLTRQEALWEYLYANPAVGDTWSLSMIQTMLSVIVGRRSAHVDATSGAAGAPYYEGAVDGQNGPQTTAALKAFQSDCGKPATGQATPETRQALFGAYMDWLCTPTDPASGETTSTGKPFRMKASDFLGGETAKLGDLPKMSLQSCGKFNPVVLLTSDEMNQTDKAERDDDDSPNRRVVIFWYEKDAKLSPDGWPCPKVKESNDACKAAFWPDGDARRKNGASLRRYRDTPDTMACRFYDRFARRSPCEKGDVLIVSTWAATDEIVDLRVEDSQGTVHWTVPCEDATREGPLLSFSLVVGELPQPCRLWFVRGWTVEFYGDPFDPLGLQKDLKALKVADAARRMDGRQ